MKCPGGYLCAVCPLAPWCPRASKTMRGIALFSAAAVTQLPNMPDVADGEHIVKWAIQSGSFAALFVVFAFIALQYLAKQLADAKSAESKTHSDVLKREEVRSETYAKLVTELAAQQAKTSILLEKVTASVDRMDKTLDGLQSTCRAMHAK